MTFRPVSSRNAFSWPDPQIKTQPETASLISALHALVPQDSNIVSIGYNEVMRSLQHGYATLLILPVSTVAFQIQTQHLATLAAFQAIPIIPLTLSPFELGTLVKQHSAMALSFSIDPHFFQDNLHIQSLDTHPQQLCKLIKSHQQLSKQNPQTIHLISQLMTKIESLKLPVLPTWIVAQQEVYCQKLVQRRIEQSWTPPFVYSFGLRFVLPSSSAPPCPPPDETPQDHIANDSNITTTHDEIQAQESLPLCVDPNLNSAVVSAKPPDVSTPIAPQPVKRPLDHKSEPITPSKMPGIKKKKPLSGNSSDKQSQQPLPASIPPPTPNVNSLMSISAFSSIKNGQNTTQAQQKLQASSILSQALQTKPTSKSSLNLSNFAKSIGSRK